MSQIRFEHVCLQYDQRLILDNISIELNEPRIGIIGRNGGGKSSFIRMINGLTRPTSGTVEVLGKDVAKQAKQIRQQVGFIFSDAENQIIMPTVLDDVMFSLKQRKIPRGQRRQAAERILEQFHLAQHNNQSPHLLSGGEKQLLALASVLALEPEIIIADEPTTLLDLGNRLYLQDIFANLSQQLIVVSHDLEFLRGFDRILCIDNHHIAADGMPHEVIRFYQNSFISGGR
ncbi:energy-coupling factor ABC transporter ATP-binding protein [Corynebacterium sp. HS2168-gen11]|uniref:energy-coupling factor ABC transporter ATP-binding protein n=1 Tax=Corynebacterium sp. HS2168-gen11 TaxID=2974027 RepID=UPI00216B5E1A|nr:ABC transporter ATP-binding protein [Corynebacterium sp. HS2168-gen11]MCS4536347.1 energy-coupling factor ABC transporter ATP-binding protein [Corynebacterium sp. HS2168-gen11]